MTMLNRMGFAGMFLAAAACGSNTGESAVAGTEAAEWGDEAPATDAPTVSGTEKLLQRIEFRDLQLSFYWLGSGSIESQQGQIGIEQTFGSADYLATLRNQYGALTALETFHAFAPPGIEPHPILISQQEPQARAFGRAEDQLQPRAIDTRDLAIEKSIPSNCSQTIFQNISPLVYRIGTSLDIGIDGVYRYLCADGIAKDGTVASPNANLNCELQHGNNMLTVGLCNDTESRDAAEFWTQTNDFRSGIRFSTQRASVAPGQVGRFDIFPFPEPFNIPGASSLAVIGRNSSANPSNFHQQLMGIGS